MLLASEVVALRQLVSTLLFVLLQSGLARNDTRCKNLQGVVSVVGSVSLAPPDRAPRLFRRARTLLSANSHWSQHPLRHLGRLPEDHRRGILSS